MLVAYPSQKLKECEVPTCGVFPETPGGWWMTLRIFCTVVSALAKLNELDVRVDVLGSRDLSKDPWGESKVFLAYRPTSCDGTVPAVTGDRIYLERFRTNHEFREWLEVEFVSCFNKVFQKLEPNHALCQSDRMWRIEALEWSSRHA